MNSHTYPPSPEPVIIRLATHADERALGLLAELDSARLPRGRVLLAERSGEPVAALALGSGPAIANPFLPTGDVVELLELRARQVSLPPESSSLVARWTARTWNAMGHAGDRLRRVFQRPDVAVERFNRRLPNA